MSNSITATNTPPREYVTPTDLDILKGKGGRTILRDAHVKLRDEVKRREQDYQTSKPGPEGKYALALEIVEIVLEGRGRFLNYEIDIHGQKWYYEMDKSSAVKLVQQKFRDTPDKRNKLNGRQSTKAIVNQNKRKPKAVVSKTEQVLSKHDDSDNSSKASGSSTDSATVSDFVLQSHHEYLRQLVAPDHQHLPPTKSADDLTDNPLAIDNLEADMTGIDNTGIHLDGLGDFNSAWTPEDATYGRPDPITESPPLNAVIDCNTPLSDDEAQSLDDPATPDSFVLNLEQVTCEDLVGNKDQDLLPLFEQDHWWVEAAVSRGIGTTEPQPSTLNGAVLHPRPRTMLPMPFR